ncbi:unnamed protein product [Closterium sp. Naga37s-1]|nr:unnamed protein product [Closterium sp. Naga37s-1]
MSPDLVRRRVSRWSEPRRGGTTKLSPLLLPLLLSLLVSSSYVARPVVAQQCSATVLCANNLCCRVLDFKHSPAFPFPRVPLRPCISTVPFLQQVGLVWLHRRLLRRWLRIRALQWSPFRLPPSAFRLSASPHKLSASAHQLSPSAHELPASANHRVPTCVHQWPMRRSKWQQYLSERSLLQHPRLRMAYFVNWAGMDPSLIPAASLTHVFYAFALINAATYQVVPSNPAVDVTQGLYLRFNSALKAANPAIKTLLSIGGYSAGTSTFTNAASSASSRSAFIQSAIHFARSYNFDGLDIDWEYPTGQMALFSALLTDFRAAIESEAASSGRPKLLLSAAVSAYEPTVTQAYDVPMLNKTLDLVNIMTYDLHGSWEAKTGMHTALEDLSNPQLSLKGAMAAWVFFHHSLHLPPFISFLSS